MTRTPLVFILLAGCLCAADEPNIFIREVVVESVVHEHERGLRFGAEFLYESWGGYREPRWWLSAGWDWVRAQRIEAPLYWRRDPSCPTGWARFTLNGPGPLRPAAWKR